jgi:hypothetical protein
VVRCGSLVLEEPGLWCVVCCQRSVGGRGWSHGEACRRAATQQVRAPILQCSCAGNSSEYPSDLAVLSLGVVVQSWTVLAWPPALAPLYVMARLQQPGPVLCGGLRGAAVAEPTNGSAVKVTLQTNNPPRRSVRHPCGQLFGHLLACFKATSPAAMCNTEESWTKLISLREFSVRLGHGMTRARQHSEFCSVIDP